MQEWKENAKKNLENFYLSNYLGISKEIQMEIEELPGAVFPIKDPRHVPGHFGQMVKGKLEISSELFSPSLSSLLSSCGREATISHDSFTHLFPPVSFLASWPSLSLKLVAVYPRWIAIDWLPSETASKPLQLCYESRANFGAMQQCSKKDFIHCA